MLSNRYVKRGKTFHFHVGFFALFLLLFIGKALILAFTGNPIVPYVGDVFVVALMYCFLAAFLNCPRFVPFGLLLLALFVELGQLFHVFGDPGDNTWVQLIFGGTFDFVDLLCYMIGALFLDIAMTIYYARKDKARRQSAQHRLLRRGLDNWAR